MRRLLGSTTFVASVLVLFGCGDDSVAGGAGGGTGGVGGAGGGNGGAGGQPTPIVASSSSGTMNGPMKIGDACAADTDCDADGFCISQATNGFPKGYCTYPCDVDEDCGNGVCATDLANPVCLKPCDGVADCRDGYGCEPFSAGTSSDVCFPDCTDTDQCAAPGECITDPADGNAGLCIAPEICGDSSDNDLDSFVDCSDNDCAADTTCAAAIDDECAAAGPFVSPESGDTTGGSELFAMTCGPIATGLGAEVLYTIDTPTKGQLHIEAEPLAGDVTLAVRSTCDDAATMVACSDDPQDGTVTEIVDVGAQGGETWTLIVDAYAPGTEGAFTLTTTFTPAVCGDGTLTLPEACDDSNAVSGDGCSDQCEVELGFYCAAATAITLGTTTGNTTTGTSFFQAPADAAECTAGAGPNGNEILYVFTPAATGMLTIDLTSTSDKDFGLYARTDCVDGATQVGCSDVSFMAGMQDESLSIPVTVAVPVTIFVDAYGVAGGAYSLALTQN